MHNTFSFPDSLMFNVFFMQALTSCGTKEGDLFFGDVSTKLKKNNITTDIKVDTNSNVSRQLS